MPEPDTRPSIPDRFLRLADGPEAELKVKGSRFVAQAFAATTAAQARARLEIIRKRYHDATHHCWATVHGPPESVEERFDDDGEPSGSAGRPILAPLRGSGACDGLVVVTRWFGGTKLGTGGLVQAYSASAGKALEQAGRITVTRQCTLTIGTSWDDVGGVESVLARRAAWIASVERDFGTGAIFRVHAFRGRIPALSDEITEQLAGRATTETGPEQLVEG